MAAYHAAGFQSAVGGDDYFADIGDDIAGVANAKAFISADQANCAGVHAAEGGDVQGNALRRVLAEVCHLVRAVGDVIVAGGDSEIIGPDAGVDCHGPGDDIGIVGVSAVQSAAGDGDMAVVDLVTGEAAVGAELRFACGQDAAIGVDKAEAVDIDACRVGDDDVGARSGDFDIALKGARAGGIDFIDDE